MRKFIVTLEGKQYEVGVEEVGGAAPVVAAPVVAQAAAPVKEAAPQKTASVNGVKLLAPMPGMIKGFKVSEGATVKKGDVIVVLEAMKMDNDLTAPADGVVSFKVAVGSNVESQDVIAVIG